jgi:hypothetical protein
LTSCFKNDIIHSAAPLIITKKREKEKKETPMGAQFQLAPGTYEAEYKGILVKMVKGKHKRPTWTIHDTKKPRSEFRYKGNLGLYMLWRVRWWLRLRGKGYMAEKVIEKAMRVNAKSALEETWKR